MLPMAKAKGLLKQRTFQRTTLAPAGGAPPTWSLHAPPGECDLKSNLTQAERTPSKVRACFSPWERLTTEPASTIEVVRCEVSYQSLSLKQAASATQVGRSWPLRATRLSSPPRGRACALNRFLW